MYPLVFLTFNDEHHFSRRGITHTIINNALEVSEVFSGYTRYPKIWSAILIVHNRCSSLKIWKINSLPGNSIICHWIAVSSARQCSIFFGVYYDIFTNLYNRCRIYNKNLKILCNWIHEFFTRSNYIYLHWTVILIWARLLPWEFKASQL